MLGIFKRSAPLGSLQPVLGAVRRHSPPVQREIAADVRSSLMAAQRDSEQIGSFHKESAAEILRSHADELEARRRRLQASGAGEDDPRLARVLLQQSLLAALLAADARVVDDVMQDLNTWFSELGVPPMRNPARNEGVDVVLP